MTIPTRARRTHYTRFRVAERLLLTGHSHQAWPDVALEGQLEAFEDAAARGGREVGARPREGRAGARRASARCSAIPRASSRSARARTSSSLRFLSALDLRRRPRLVTTDGEFHTLRRQLARLGEEWLDVEVVPAPPGGHARRAARRARRRSDRRGARLGRALRGRADRARARRARGARARGAASSCSWTPTTRSARSRSRSARSGSARRGSSAAGTSTCSSGRGTAFCGSRRTRDDCRPAITGWFAEFGALEAGARPELVPYGRGAARVRRRDLRSRRATTAPRACWTSSSRRASRRSALRASYRRQVGPARRARSTRSASATRS